LAGKIKVLHVTAHLGGGVGRVLSGLTRHNRGVGEIENSIICLEPPQDRRHADAIAAAGVPLSIAPDDKVTRIALSAADIVQIEWWHHPLMARWLASASSIPARWVIWAHVSGLHYPAIPLDFVRLPHAFVATTDASLPLLDKDGGNIVTSVSSAGGFADFPLRGEAGDVEVGDKEGMVRCGYIGAFNPGKLHPGVLDFLNAVGRPDFVVDFYGDSSVNPALEGRVRAAGAQCPMRLRGFSARPQYILPALDLFIYLLNPTHYGTTENALLEAMASGAVPVVLNNRVESAIVQHGETGFVVDGVEDFASTMHRLLDDAGLRRRIGQAAAARTRRDFSIEASAAKLAAIYRAAMGRDKAPANFAGVLGNTPVAMFRACLGDYAACFDADEPRRAERLALPFLYDMTKSSVFQFYRYFPDDVALGAYELMLYRDMESQQGPGT
jgi:hypothetical protein